MQQNTETTNTETTNTETISANIQGSKEWHKMRSAKLGASDAPIITKVSPWQTPYQLWLRKSGLEQEENDTSNYATERGHLLEDEARKHYELETNIPTEPKVFVSQEYPFLMASLDGWNEEHGLVLEIKSPGQKAHSLAKEGKIPEYYYPQLQHQMLVANSDICHYYSFDGVDGVLVRVPRNSEYINDELLPSLMEFWHKVQTKTPPELTDRDYKRCSDDQVLNMVSDYALLKVKLDETKKEMDELRTKIFERCDHPRMIAGKAKIVRFWRSGSIDYKKIPELSGVDLDKYRKEPSQVSMIKFSSEKK